MTLITRWHEFPWNRWITTSFSLGLGPSYTTSVPRLESDRGDHSKVLNQANLEFTFALPDMSWHEVFFRLQHRSGIFGLIDGVGEGSNFLTFGYRYRFGGGLPRSPRASSRCC